MNYSDFDSLTGLGNTRLMQARFAQCAGEQTEFGIILIDIDGFIYFNDRYGHNEGDEKLKTISKSNKIENNRLKQFADISLISNPLASE